MSPAPQKPSAPAPMIRLNKLVRASRERVWAAWTDPDQFCQWWAPGPTEICRVVHIDLRVGGAFRFEMESKGKPMGSYGTYTRVEAPSVLAFTWTWEQMPEFGGDSLVTIELIETENPYEDGPATEVVFTHEKLRTAAERSEHTTGWWNTLRALGYHVRGIDPREAMYGGSESAKA